VGYVYDEGERAEREAAVAHLAMCPACAAEVEAMQATRRQLAAWAPPEPAGRLAADVTSATPAPVLRPPRWWQGAVPVWAQAAAALVLFAAGLALGGTTSRWLAAPAPPAAAVSPDALADAEQRLRAEIDDLRGAMTAVADGDADTLARVRALIVESEARQQRELALRTADVLRDFDAQRRLDLARVDEAVGEMQDLAGAEAAEQRRLLDYLIRVSQQPR
jgi:hypothetical protein